MTQPQPPIDLDAIQARYDAVGQHVPIETGETGPEYHDRVDALRNSAAWDSCDDIPALIAEIQHLRSLLIAEGLNGWEEAPVKADEDGVEGLIDVKKHRGVESWVLTCSEHGEVGRYPMVFLPADERPEPELAWDAHVQQLHPGKSS